MFNFLTAYSTNEDAADAIAQVCEEIRVQLAGAAKRSGDSEAQLEQLEAAVEAMYNALHALGEVAADQSDRGVIAVLAEFGYRPLVAEFEKVQDEAE